jgi:hypothetical protein
MKNIIKTSVFVFAIALSFISNSCDKFDTLPLNVPFSVAVTTGGSSNPTAANPVTYCLSSSETYSDYVEDIEKLTFVEAAWRTVSVSNITEGDVTVTVRILGGAILFQKTLSGINPASYMSPNSPFVLSLTAAEIDALNSYLETYRANPGAAPCLQASVSAFVTTGTAPYSLSGIVDMVVEAEIKL